jgi:hypothetical protein
MLRVAQGHLLGLEVSELMTDPGQFADVRDHIIEHMNESVHLDTDVFEQLNGRIGRPLAESSEQ